MFFSLGSFFFYPNPVEIIVLTIIGYGIFFALLFAYGRWDRTHKTGNNGKRILFLAFITIYIISFMLVQSTSWYGKRLIFNIFETKDGRAFFIITVSLFTLVLLYYLLFYLKHGRWPKNKDLGI